MMFGVECQRSQTLLFKSLWTFTKKGRKMINKKQKEELLSSSFSARLSAILKTSDINVELSSEEEVTSSIKVTFLENGEEKMFLT